MPGLSDYDCEGSLVIGSISMNRPAWGVFGDDDGDGTLWSLLTNVEQRGEDRILPTVPGVIAYRRRNTVTAHELGLTVVGDVDETGAANADHTLGLFDNLDYIMSNVVAPVASATGTRAATWTPPGSSSLSANIHVLGLRMERQALGLNAIWEGRLLISIPGGTFSSGS